MDSQKLEILHKHYESTDSIIRDYIKARDKRFFWILLLTILMLFQIYSPAGFQEAAQKALSFKFGLAESPDISFLSSVLWFFLFCSFVKYSQIVSRIENQYAYIHKLEDELSKHFPSGTFTREGKHYLNDYPWTLDWASVVYSAVFPAALILVMTARIIIEYHQGAWGLLRVADTFLYAALLLSIFLHYTKLYRGLFS